MSIGALANVISDFLDFEVSSSESSSEEEINSFDLKTWFCSNSIISKKKYLIS